MTGPGWSTVNGLVVQVDNTTPREILSGEICFLELKPDYPLRVRTSLNARRPAPVLLPARIGRRDLSGRAGYLGAYPLRPDHNITLKYRL